MVGDHTETKGVVILLFIYFPLWVGMHDVGSLCTAQYSFFIPKHFYEETVAWTMQHRNHLDIMVHPNTGCEVEDHTVCV